MTRNYCSFMLRLKQVQTDDLQTWVVSMQNTQTGYQRVFSNVDGLIQFLQTEFGNDLEEKDSSQSGTHDTQNIPIQ